MSATAHTPRILVTGGGIAGNAVALQLIRAGIRTTVVERADAPRPGGQAVDLRGPSRRIAEQMGLMPAIRERQLHEEGMRLVDADGAQIYAMPADMFDGKGPVADIEITRGDLNQVLLDRLAAETAAGAAELDYRYSEWIESIDQDDSGVTVTFASGTRERFDLVIGADGVHSATRRLVFGPEEQFATYLGGYISFFTVPTPPEVQPHWMTIHAVPSASVGYRPDLNPATSKVVITLRTEQRPGLRGDLAAQHDLIRDMLGPAGWLAPAALDAMAAAPDFYFDELVRIELPSPTSGRVTLLGDAGSCGSPMTGMGTAAALVGAYVLAGEIAATPADLAAATARYESIIAPFLAKARELPGGGLKMQLPTTKLGMRAATTVGKLLTTRLFRPVMARMLDQTENYELPTY